MLNSEEIVNKNNECQNQLNASTRQQNKAPSVLPNALKNRTICTTTDEGLCEISLRVSTVQNRRAIQRQSAPSRNHKKYHLILDDFSRTDDVCNTSRQILKRHSLDQQIPKEYIQHGLLLEDIKALVKFKFGSSIQTTQINKFAKAFLGDYYQYLPLLDSQDNFSSFLGKIIYLIDQNPETIINLSENYTFKKSIFEISEAFDEKIRDIKSRIIKSDEILSDLNLQKEKIAKNIQLPMEISHILIPASGIINYAIIPKITQEFITEKPPLKNYPYRIHTGLNLLYKFEKLRKQIQESTLPANAKDPGSLLIKISLMLNPEKELSNTDAIKTIVAGFLTHHRQGRSGSCFAAFLAIGLQNSEPEKMINDFQSLIRHGKLSRTVDDEAYSFPYLLKMSEEELNYFIQIDEEGTFSTANEKKLKIWEIPDLIALCCFLGLKSPQIALKNWLDTLSFHEGYSFFTLYQLIAGLCLSNGIDAIGQANLAYCSRKNNLLLNSWENTIAGMAEAHKKSLLRGALVQTTLFFIEKISKKLSDLVTEAQVFALKAFIEKLIHQRCHYVYDPAYSPSEESKIPGAFILYDTCNLSDPTQWKRIDSIQDFQLFIRILLEESISALSHIGDLVITPQFTEQFSLAASAVHFLKRYHTENSSLLSKNIPITHFRYTPWITIIGNNPEMVLKAYHESEALLAVSTIRPKNPMELLTMIDEKFDALSIEEKKKYLINGECFLPIRIQGIHTFSLLPWHPTMKLFSNEKIDVVSYVQEKIIKIGHTTSELYLTSSAREKILACTYLQVNNKELTNIIKKKFFSEDPSISIIKFRHKLMVVLTDILPANISLNKLLREIDLIIIEFLSKPICKIWEDSIIHLADSNWQYSGNDIHYGIGVNPGSGKLEILMVKDNGKIYSFLDQNKFFGNQSWEFYLHVDHLSKK